MVKINVCEAPKNGPFANEEWLVPNSLFVEINIEPTPGSLREKDYFSITTNGRYFGGCCHPLILAVRPDLKPLVDLHLSNLNGEPGHAVENAEYWVSGVLTCWPGYRYRPEQSVEKCFEILATHLRIDPQPLLNDIKRSTIDTLHLWKRRMVPVSFVVRDVRAVIVKHVDELRPRWSEEAVAGLALIDKLSHE